MEPVNVNLELNGIVYSITITYIGEIIELPDGSGDLPVEYTSTPECPEEDKEALHEELTKFVTNAIQAAIAEAKIKDEQEE